MAYQIIYTQLLQLQHNRPQIGSQNLGICLLLKVLLE